MEVRRDPGMDFSLDISSSEGVTSGTVLIVSVTFLTMG